MVWSRSVSSRWASWVISDARTARSSARWNASALCTAEATRTPPRASAVTVGMVMSSSRRERTRQFLRAWRDCRPAGRALLPVVLLAGPAGVPFGSCPVAGATAGPRPSGAPPLLRALVLRSVLAQDRTPSMLITRVAVQARLLVLAAEAA